MIEINKLKAGLYRMIRHKTVIAYLEKTRFITVNKRKQYELVKT